MEMIDKMEIVKIISFQQEITNDNIIREYAMTLIVNDVEIATLMCSPDSLQYLAIGFLLSENIIDYKEDYREIVVDEKNGIVNVKLAQELKYKKNKIIYTDGRDLSIDKDFLNNFRQIKLRSDIKLNYEYLFNISKELDDKSVIFKKTGGTHSACLCDEKGMILFREDVSRHNAIDKILGEAFIKEISLDNKFVFVSGRLTSEMLLKIVRVGGVIIISRSAPTDLAVKIARNLNITLVGFVRGNRMNIYSGELRIVCKKNI